MFWIFLAPAVGLALAFILNKVFPKALFRGYDVLPFFFCFACHLITTKEQKPEFLPYGFLLFFILVIVVAVFETIKYKNISLQKTLRQLWDYLTTCTIFWYIGLLFLMI